ncbi:caspase family protein [Mesorhizobium sp. M1060]|uniref:caspase family protein n=1 Tax=unclassified Mesorhizobium TaxID=325217 RepID=UPI0003D016B9|nr:MULTISPECIES: caspase family protein [unclassified Mesorhizobium]ESZ04413.1 hypothetical protein X736_22075 [Mesorhizobium sp. L2C089B000]WJI52356.1 caspase family protein [Mesorhizobium sp. C089B]
MAVRALIVAIENYPNVQGGALAKELPGTLKAGLAFRTWLVKKWDSEGVKAKDRHLIFCSQPVQPEGRPATAEGIREAMLELKQKGAGRTDELYVYFSGHGFTFASGPGVKKSIFVASDFKNANVSGNCCLPIDEIVVWLRAHLGPGSHAYFIDACRNKLDGSVITISSPILPFNTDTGTEASTFVLHSTTDGRTTLAGGPFHPRLMEGLQGKGRAKVWDDSGADLMNVQYTSLRRYLKTALQDPVDGEVDGTADDMTLAWLKPAPDATCTITIEGSKVPDGTIAYRRGRDTNSVEQPFQGTKTVLRLKPDAYTFSVRAANTIFEQSELRQELYDDAAITFRIASSRGPLAPTPGERGLENFGLRPKWTGSELGTAVSAGEVLEEAVVGADAFGATLDIVVPPDCTLELINVNSRTQTKYLASGKANVEAGDYTALLKDQNGQIIGRKDIGVSAGSDVELDLAQWRHSTPHVSIAKSLEITDDGWVDFSKSLDGPVVDPDLDLWLALAGAGRILLGSSGTDFRKLSNLPLHDFSGEKAGSSPIYVLAGLENPQTKLDVGLSKATNVEWHMADRPNGLDGIAEAYFPVDPGSHLISFHVGENAPYTVSTLASPNRAMLVTLALDKDGAPTVSQYLLPLGHLIDQLPHKVRNVLTSRNQLKDVESLANANRAFRKRRNVFEVLPGNRLNEILDMKWLDPITSALAAYECLRRGQKAKMGVVVKNMAEFFGDLPDSWALARLAGMSKVGSPPAGVPLFLDGLKADPDYAERLPLPASHLDYSSPWTAWWDAVK